MQVKEIIDVKDRLDQLVQDGLARSWELPYENILTRRSAAIFFVDPIADMDGIADVLAQYDNFSYRKNEEHTLSNLPFRITFSQEDKEINQKPETVAL